jgi:hypothetical protein
MLGTDIGGDIDDFVYKADHELGTAPADPGTYECDAAKPGPDDEPMNKWCVRECERSTFCDKGGSLLVLKDMDRPMPNCGSRHEEWKKKYA